MRTIHLLAAKAELDHLIGLSGVGALLDQAKARLTHLQAMLGAIRRGAAPALTMQQASPAVPRVEEMRVTSQQIDAGARQREWDRGMFSTVVDAHGQNRRDLPSPTWMDTEQKIQWFMNRPVGIELRMAAGVATAERWEANADLARRQNPTTIQKSLHPYTTPGPSAGYRNFNSSELAYIYNVVKTFWPSQDSTSTKGIHVPKALELLRAQIPDMTDHALKFKLRAVRSQHFKALGRAVKHKTPASPTTPNALTQATLHGEVNDLELSAFYKAGQLPQGSATPKTVAELITSGKESFGLINTGAPVVNKKQNEAGDQEEGKPKSTFTLSSSKGKKSKSSLSMHENIALFEWVARQRPRPPPGRRNIIYTATEKEIIKITGGSSANAPDWKSIVKRIRKQVEEDVAREASSSASARSKDDSADRNGEALSAIQVVSSDSDDTDNSDIVCLTSPPSQAQLNRRRSMDAKTIH